MTKDNNTIIEKVTELNRLLNIVTTMEEIHYNFKGDYFPLFVATQGNGNISHELISVARLDREIADEIYSYYTTKVIDLADELDFSPEQISEMIKEVTKERLKIVKPTANGKVYSVKRKT